MRFMTSMEEIDFERVRRWAFDIALPLWADCGVDRAFGGFEEELDFTGRSANVPFKRTRVAGRQIYVFSHSALLGWGRGAEIADQGVEFLIKSAWLGPDGGWARRVSRSGEVIDATADLYDLAFVLFGLSWHFRMSGAQRSRELAFATLQFVQTHMRRHEAFAHEKGATGWYQQNPHMHLLEACLVAAEAFRDDVFIRQADELVALFRRRFFDGATLAEFFREDWSRADDIVEPGHQMEWAWILSAYAKLTGADLGGDDSALMRFAEQYGVDPMTGLTANQVHQDGSRVDWGSRTWPNTERIKGHLALFERYGSDPRPAVKSSLNALFGNHLGRAPQGLWLERIGAGTVMQPQTSPASTLYHLFLAFSELLRLRPELERIP